MMEKTHSILPPSSGDKWRICTGWVTLTAAHPAQPSGEQAMEGDAAHYVADKLLLQATGRVYGSIPKIGDPAPNGVEITSEIYNGAKGYVESILFDLIRLGKTWDAIERSTHIGRVHAQCKGYVDYTFLDKSGALHVRELKFGRLFVQVQANPQMVLYGIGLVDELNLPDKTPVIFTVNQPRTYRKSGPIRSWSTTAGDLRVRASAFERAAHVNLGPVQNQQLIAGTHCLYCDNRLLCGPAIQMTELYMRFSGAAIPETISLRGLGRMMKDIDLASKYLEKLKTTLEERLKGEIRNGRQVPGWDMIPVSGREEWTRPNEEIIAAGKFCGIALEKTTLITPNQARDAGLPESVISKYAGRPRKGFSLVPEDPDKAYKAFGGK